IAQRETHGLRVLDSGVVDDRRGKGLARFAGGEIERAAGGGVIAARGGGAVAGRETDAGPDVGSARPRNGNSCGRLSFTDGVVRGAELEGAGLSDIVRMDAQRCRGLTAEARAAGRAAQCEVHSLVILNK